MKLKYCVLLTVTAFLLSQSAVTFLFLPLVRVIQNLSGGEMSKVPQTPVPTTWLMAGPVCGLAAVTTALALTSVVFTIRGLRRETGSRVGWAILLAFGALVLLYTCGLAVGLVVAAPKFAMLFRDLGIK